MWIIIGITVCSLFTASLTSEITSATTTESPLMAASKVGVLKGRLYDLSVVTKKGGYVEVTTATDLMPGIFELITKLRNDSISGFLLDTYTYVYVLNELQKIYILEKHEKYNDAHFFLNETFKQRRHETEKVFHMGCWSNIEMITNISAILS